MLLGFKTELRLNNKQRTALAKHCGVCRHAWNWGLGLTKQILDHNRDTREDKIKFPTGIDLHKWLVALVKPLCPWYYEVSKCAPQFALRQLAQAWKDAFKKNKKPPRFKRKGKHDSFTLDGSIQLDHFKIRVPRIGWLKTYERLPVRFQPKTVTISRTADRWFISFKLEYEPVNRPKSYPVVGVDLGIKALAVLSTGIVVEGAKSYRKYENFEFKRQLEYKCKLYGSTLVEVDRWYPSTKTCSRCHTVKDEMPLSKRVFRCDNCGLEIDRDFNASINLEIAAS